MSASPTLTMPDCTPEAACSEAAFVDVVVSVGLEPQPASKATATAMLTVVLPRKWFLIRITCSSLAVTQFTAGTRKKGEGAASTAEATLGISWHRGQGAVPGV